MKKGLKKNLVDYALYFIEAEEEYGINAIFLAALSAVESGWGEYPTKQNNLFGWTSSTYYNSAKLSIKPTAKKIKEYYLTKDGKYHRGFTLESVNINYNGRQEWYDRVSKMMYQIACSIY